MSFSSLFPISAFTLAGAFLAPIAMAHIDVDQAGTHFSRYGMSSIKEGPCGMEGGTRGTNIYSYEPGETIAIAMKEFVPHPGYFRIAFDTDGDDSFLNPQSIDPINRECMDDPADHCGASDFYNNETVLMDNLEPHLRGLPKTYTFNVKLPNVECDNCTIQLIQVMTDGFPIHAPYDPAYTSEDVYYQCIDVVLKKKTAARPIDASTRIPSGMEPVRGPVGVSAPAVDLAPLPAVPSANSL